MKKLIAVTVLSISVMCFVSGCGALDKAYKKVMVKPAETNQITSYVTNTITLTNSSGQLEQQNQVTPTIKTVVKPAVYELQENSAIEGGLSLAQSVPIPYVGLGASVIAALYGFYGKMRNGKALQAVVQGIDDGRKLLQTSPELQKIDAQIKDQLIRHQEINGVLKEVSSVVSDYTGDTVPPIKT